MVSTFVADLDDVSGVFAVVEEALHISFLGSVDDDRERIHRTGDLTAEHVRQSIACLASAVPRFAQLVDLFRKVSLQSQTTQTIAKHRKHRFFTQTPIIIDINDDLR